MPKEETNIPQSVKKLINYFETVTSSTKVTEMYMETNGDRSLIESVKNFVTVCETLARIYSCPMEDWGKIPEGSGDFPALSFILELSDFSDKDRSEIVFYLIKRNLVSGFANVPTIVLKTEEIMYFPFRDVSAKEVYQFVTTDALYHVSQKKAEERSEKEKILLRELERCIKTQNMEVKDIATYHHTIQKHYFNKKDCFNFEDIALVLEALESLEVSPLILDSVNKTLRKEIRQRNANLKDSLKTKDNASEAKKEKTKKEKNSLIDNKKRREEKAIYKKLSDTYSIEEDELLVLPTEEAINGWLSYAELVDLPLTTRRKFLHTVYRKIRTMDPIVQYGMFYKKLKHYENTVDSSKDLEEVEQYLDAILEAKEEEITFWEEELNDKLGCILKLIPQEELFNTKPVK